MSGRATLCLLLLAVGPLAAAAQAVQRVCGTANERGTLSLTCPTGTVVSAITFASYGTPSGSCPSFAASTCSADETALLSSTCLGKPSCTVAVSNDNMGGDPCSGVGKKLAAVATCSSGTASTGAPPPPSLSPSPAPVPGASTVCAQAHEGNSLQLTCPANALIAAISFASYGTPSGSCPSFAASTCSTDVTALLSSTCLGKPSCTVAVSNDNMGGDPCSGTGKDLAVVATCSGDAPPPVDPCAGVSCGAHGTCAGGTCSCKDGYSGDHCQLPPSPPSPPNPCQTNNGGCGSSLTTTCSFAAGAVTCACKPGFIGQPPATPCAADPNVNPCLTNNGGCGDADTTACTPTRPKVTCSCKADDAGFAPASWTV